MKRIGELYLPDEIRRRAIQPTPETDAVAQWPLGEPHPRTMMERYLQHARKLERERDSAKTLNRSLLDQLEAKDAQIEALRTAIKEAYDAIKAVPLEYDARFFRAGKWSEAALAKLQPFLP